jgi:hypothetical protein
MSEKGFFKLNEVIIRREVSLNGRDKTQGSTSVQIHNTLKDISGLLYCLKRSKLKLRK